MLVGIAADNLSTMACSVKCGKTHKGTMLDGQRQLQRLIPRQVFIFLLSLLDGFAHLRSRASKYAELIALKTTKSTS